MGQYFFRDKSSTNESYLYREGLPFYFKFCKGKFLRIGIGSNHPYKDYVGKKLAALSDFYKVLSELYGEPTVFYTMKADEEGELTLQLSFRNKEEEIEKFKNGSYFDDGEINELIVIGEPKSKKGYLVKDAILDLIGRKIGLPIDLLDLVMGIKKIMLSIKISKNISTPM